MSYIINDGITINPFDSATNETTFSIELESVDKLSIVPNNSTFHRVQFSNVANVEIFGEALGFRNDQAGSFVFETDQSSTSNVLVQLPITNPIGPYQSWLTGTDGRLIWDTMYPTFQAEFDVQKNPNPLQYGSITEALSAIGGDPGVPVAIYVHPGVYEEPATLDVPSNVYIIGIGMQPVVVSPGWVSPDQPMFRFTGGGGRFGLAFLTLEGNDVNPTSYAIECNDPGDFLLFFKMEVNGWRNCWHTTAEMTESYVYLEYCATNFDDDMIGNTSIYSRCDSGGFLSLSVENGFFFGPCDTHMLIEGSNNECLLSASTIQNANEFANFPYGTGLKCINGAKVTVRGVFIEGMNEATIVPSTTVSPNVELKMSGVLYDHNVNNISILSNICSGFFNGYTEYEKTWIERSSGFFITNSDNNIVTVAKKGGNFDSVKAAVDWIKNYKQPSSTNPFDVYVGPGIYVEDPIMMYPFISLTGENKFTTTIQPKNTSSTIITGNINSSVQSVALSGATGSGGVALAYHGSLLGNNTFRAQDLFFNSSNTLISVSTDNGPVGFSMIQMLIGPASNFFKGLSISGTNYPLRFIASQISWFTFATPSSFDTFVDVVSTATTMRDKVYFSGIFGGSDSLTISGTGISIGGSVSVYMQGGGLAGFSNAIIIPSGYSQGPSLIAGGITTAGSSNYDLYIDNPNTQGFLNFQAEQEQIYINPAAENVSYVAASNTGELVMAADLFQGPTNNTITFVSDQWQKGGVTGLISGNVSATFSTRIVSVSSGSGYVTLNTVSPVPQTLRYLSWNSPLNVILPASTGDYYIYITHDTILEQSLTEPLLTENILLGRARVELVGGVSYEIVWFLDETQTAINPVNALSNNFRDLSSPLVVSGVLVNASGVNTNVNITSGSLRWGTQIINPSQMMSPNFYAYTEQSITSTAVANVFTSGVPRVYSNGGTITNLTTNQWAKHSIYLSGQSNFQQTYLILASNTYSTSSDALSNSAPFAPQFINEAIFPLADVVVTGNTAVSLTNSLIQDTRPFLAVSGSSGGSQSTPTTLDHNALLNLTVGDPHTQYLPANGSRPMIGDLDMGTNDVVNAGTYNGVTVETHASRHQPGGADPLITASAITITDFTNSEGIASTLARSDHVHAHGVRGGGNLHAIVTQSANGFMSATDKVILDNATNLPAPSTLMRRNANAEVSIGNAANLYYAPTNRQTSIKVSPVIVANFDFVLPSSQGLNGQILQSLGTGVTQWTNNSIFIDPTSNVGDMIVRGTSNLVALAVPTQNGNAGANIQYSLNTNQNRYPSWDVFPFNPYYSAVNFDDFTGATNPFSETGYRGTTNSSATMTQELPSINPGTPFGVVAFNIPSNNGSAFMTKAPSSGPLSGLTFSTNGTVFYEIAVQFSSNINQTNTLFEAGFSNATTTASPTRKAVFATSPTGLGVGVPLIFQLLNASGVPVSSATLQTLQPNQWYRLRFVIFGITQIYIWINDVLVLNNTFSLTNLPTDALDSSVKFERVGGNSVSAYVDYIQFAKYYTSAGRY